VVSALISFHLISSPPMTEIVSRLFYKHRFQYVERRYFGFVALSFVVGADSGGDARENPGVKKA
jgi:hypothetical protein